jgi:hypothetical protein
MQTSSKESSSWEWSKLLDNNILKLINGSYNSNVLNLILIHCITYCYIQYYNPNINGIKAHCNGPKIILENPSRVHILSVF